MMNSRPILIVDDDSDIRAVVRRTLAAQGYRTPEAGDGIAAFDSARHDPPALIVLDLGRPGQDGWAVAQQIRAEPCLDAVPILVLTAYDCVLARGRPRCRMSGRDPKAIRTYNAGNRHRIPT